MYGDNYCEIPEDAEVNASYGSADKLFQEAYGARAANQGHDGAQKEASCPTRPAASVKDNAVRPESIENATTRRSRLATNLLWHPDLIEHQEKPSSCGSGDSLAGQTHELRRLKNKSGDHTGPDALVYTRDGFDPAKPVRLVVYNHGFNTDVAEAFRNSGLRRQMDLADPQTVLIMPEWQAKPQSRNSDMGILKEPNAFRNMLLEIMSKTPTLQCLSLDNVDSISIVSHSAGWRAAVSQIYNNGLQDKVTSVVLLDSLYDGTAFDRWISQNLLSLASGQKRFFNVFASSTEAQSRAQIARIKGMLSQAGLPQSALLVDDSRPNSVLEPAVIGTHGLAAKRSSLRVEKRDAHNSVTNIYFGQNLLASRKLNALRPDLEAVTLADASIKHD